MANGIGKCECIEERHKLNIVQSLEYMIDTLNRNIKDVEERREIIDEAASKGLSMHADAMLYTIRNKITDKESTLRKVKNIPDCV